MRGGEITQGRTELRAGVPLRNRRRQEEKRQVRPEK